MVNRPIRVAREARKVAVRSDNVGDLSQLIHRPIITEKAIRLLEENKYTFDVAPKATKPEIKAAIEALFKVKVVKINTANPPRRQRRVGQFSGFRPSYKRAIVTLAEGNSIVLFPEV
ncbi:MAG: 50S ribosomal protein L23 [Synechococcales cyanobacterium]